MNLPINGAWDWNAKPNEEQVVRLKALGLKHGLKPNGEFDWDSRDFVATIADALSVGIPFEVKGIAGKIPKEYFVDALKRIEERQTAPAPINETCNVVVGGATLLHIDTVTVRENFCTDELQRELDAGWRLLAVCVQPDGRRPDYVLGKTGGGK
jgi:hypothetical protein